MKYKVRDKCKVWKDVCGMYASKVGADHIQITGIDEPNENYYYNILDKDGNKLGSCFACLKDEHLTPLNEFQIPFYVDCPTQEIWDKVEKKMFEMGYKWHHNKGHQKYNGKDMIEVEGNPPTIGAENDTPYNPKSKHIPYQQFLGEEVKEREFNVGDEVLAIDDDPVNQQGTIQAKVGDDYYRITFPEWGKGWTHGKDKHCWHIHKKSLRLITPVEEKEEKHKNLVAEYPLPPMYTLTNDWTNGGGYVSFGVDLGTEQVNPFYKLSKSLMSGFKKATAFIKRLGEPLSTYYSLGWVELENDEFTTTAEGKQALADFTLIGGAKTFEEYAKKELARRKKASKVKDEDED